ncbi:unnamed protein product [Caenorhabditis auriculariae]|uniref:MADF domain-containing protein n=1 Tax=Caenorhabditis auriculariae TaxID=2777116 RepID=A0A8S1H3X3_9PELO|nr:unnamed protein product [Caenorhabditis auriculariae]
MMNSNVMMIKDEYICRKDDYMMSPAFGRLTEELIEPTFNLRLIEAVKHSRCIFDSGDRQYRNTEYKNKVWNRLVSVLSFEGDPRALASRWKQLRDKYGKEKRKAKYSAEPSVWQYYKHLQFLDPHMTDRTDVSPSRKENHDVQLVVTDPSFPGRLIDEVHLQPCLFDIRDPKYRHSDCRHQAWNQIIQNLRYPSNISSIYKQWKKLRDRYVREKRRLKLQADAGIHEESTWELYGAMQWMDPYLDDRAQCSRTMKRLATQDDLSDFELDDDLNYMMMGGDKRGGNTVYDVPKRVASGGDVMLDGDSAFSASIVSDLRTLPEPARAQAKQLIEMLLETGKMPIM